MLQLMGKQQRLTLNGGLRILRLWWLTGGLKHTTKRVRRQCCQDATQVKWACGVSCQELSIDRRAPH